MQYKGTTPYVVYNGKAFTPRFTVKEKNGQIVDPSEYTYVYRENTRAGTGYVIVTFKDNSIEQAQAWFKIYLPATESMEAVNVEEGIKLVWKPVIGAAGYVIYRRALTASATEWTSFERWNNTTELTWTDTTVYAGTSYEYGVKAYFTERFDPISGTMIGGNVGDNYNLGLVGPLKMIVRVAR